MDNDDRKKIRKLIAKYSYKTLLENIESIEKEMAEEIKTLFKFNIFDHEGKDYIFIDNLVTFLSKLEPYIDGIDLNEIPINATKIGEETFFALEQLLALMRSLDPNVVAFNLSEIADYILEQSQNKS